MFSKSETLLRQMCSQSPSHPAPVRGSAHVPSHSPSKPPLTHVAAAPRALLILGAHLTLPLMHKPLRAPRPWHWVGPSQRLPGLVSTQIPPLSQRRSRTTPHRSPHSPPTSSHPRRPESPDFQPGVLLPLRRRVVMSGDICSCHSWRGTRSAGW